MQENQELSVVKQQVSKALKAANDLAIESGEGMMQATDVLSKIKTVGKMIKARKEEITKPLMEALTSARDLFKPIETSHAEAEQIIKSKMLQWQDKEEKRIEGEKAKIAARVEKGTMKVETAVAKMEALPDQQATTKGKVGTVTMRIIKKVRIVDANLIPREYLEPNTALINEAVLKQGKEIPGTETYEEKSISAR